MSETETRFSPETARRMYELLVFDRAIDNPALRDGTQIRNHCAELGVELPAIVGKSMKACLEHFEAERDALLDAIARAA